MGLKFKKNSDNMSIKLVPKRAKKFFVTKVIGPEQVYEFKKKNQTKN